MHHDPALVRQKFHLHGPPKDTDKKPQIELMSAAEDLKEHDKGITLSQLKSEEETEEKEE